MTTAERALVIRILRAETLERIDVVAALRSRDDMQARAMRNDLAETMAVLARLQREQLVEGEL